MIAIIVAMLSSCVIISMVANKCHDAYRSHAHWQRLYRYPKCFDQWYLRWFKRKFSNRWHIAKQIMFIPPLGALVLLMAFEYDATWTATATAIIGTVLWKWGVPDPEWWNNNDDEIHG